MKYKTILDVAKEDSESLVVLDNLKSFYQFVYDRQKVWHNRFVLKRPQGEWTDNEILRRSKYTNVFRELDRGTLWWDRNINLSIKDTTEKEIVWQTCVYRLLNKVETFDKVNVPKLANFKRKSYRNKWFKSIRRMLERGEKVWTSATITLQSNLKATRLENLETITVKLLEDIGYITEVTLRTDSIQELFLELKKCYGFGPFTSYEVVTDLAYCEWTNFDNNTWANAGPGCIPGIKLIFPWASNQEDYLVCMKIVRDNQQRGFKKLELNFNKIAFPVQYLDLRNTEHSLCEWRKYYSEVKGVGRARPKFTPISPDTLYST